MKAFRIALPIVGALALGAALGTATLAFADTGTSSPATSSSTPLTIGNLRVAVDTASATVRWHTSQAADSKVEYGTSTSYGMTLTDSDYVSEHALVLKDLAAGTTYHFKVISSDGTDRAASGDETFTTATSSGGTGTSTVSTTITNVRAVNVEQGRAAIDWHTDQLADSKVQYGTTTSYGLTANDSTDVQAHSVVLTGLAADTEYHYRVISSNDNGTTKSADYTFMTTSGSSTLAAPALVSPADGATLTSDELGDASWSAVSDSNGGITYVYQSSTSSSTNADGSFTSPAYTSSPLATTSISIVGTPEGTYYWHVMASDSAGTDSDWSPAWSFTVSNASGGGAEPVISDVAAGSTSSTTAAITWTTDQAATSQVFYGLDDTYGASTTLDADDVTSHSVTLSGLAADTTYHFMVESANASGTATSSDMTVTTAGSSTVGGNVGLSLLGIDTIKGTASADGSFADGFEWVFHFVVPQNETQFAMEFSDFWNTVNASDTIPAAGDIEYYSAQSDNATSSDSAVTIDAADAYPSTMLDLTGDASSTADGRQVDVVVDMKVPSGTAPGDYLGDWGAESTTTATSTP